MLSSLKIWTLKFFDLTFEDLFQTAKCQENKT